MKEPFAKRMKEAMEIRNLKQVDITEKTQLTKSAISQYVSGMYEPKQNALHKIAMALDVSEAWLMGLDVPMDRQKNQEPYPDNLFKIETRRLPMLGTIAAGEPIYAQEDIEYYVEVGAHIKADFCLKVKGDSMINARIQDGDIVFIRQQSMVDEGQIAAVLIDDEATLKRVYRTNGSLVLMSENPNYKPLVFDPEEGKDIRILGKAVAFQSDVL